MNKPEKIQINYDLFVDMYIYIIRHSEPGDMQFERIIPEVRHKIDAMSRRELYTLYKSGATPEERSKARADYLDKIGILESYRWKDEDDFNVTR